MVLLESLRLVMFGVTTQLTWGVMIQHPAPLGTNIPTAL